jgi:hypothetical protein
LAQRLQDQPLFSAGALSISDGIFDNNNVIAISPYSANECNPHLKLAAIVRSTAAAALLLKPTLERAMPPAPESAEKCV